MTRTVTLCLSSGYGTPYIHQPIYWQLSVGDKWIPPSGPVRVPKSGGGDSPKTYVGDVATGMAMALAAASKEGRASVSGVTSVMMAPAGGREPDTLPPGDPKEGWAPAKGPDKYEEVFCFDFETDADRLDYGVAGVNTQNELERGGTGSQLRVALLVRGGEPPVRVFRTTPRAIFEARNGWEGDPLEAGGEEMWPQVGDPSRRGRPPLHPADWGSYGDYGIFPAPRLLSVQSLAWHDPHMLAWVPIEGLCREVGHSGLGTVHPGAEEMERDRIGADWEGAVARVPQEETRS